MITNAVKELLSQRKAEKNVTRTPVCNKPYQVFVMERHNVKVQMAARHESLLLKIAEINNSFANDPTFKFVVWDYGTFYSVQVFEGEEGATESVHLGEKNTNWADEHNLYIHPPICRKRFKTLKGLEAYIRFFYSVNIKPMNDLLASRDELSDVKVAYEINTVQLHEANFKDSRAVEFDSEMMIFWNKHKLLPVIQKLVNGKRYNRTTHGVKVKNALENNRIVEQEGKFIVFWNK